MCEYFMESDMENERTVTCPFCYNHVPWGAGVCRGCHAVLSYGASNKWYLGAFILSIYFYLVLSKFFNGWFIAMLMGVVSFAYLSYLIGEKFSDRVIFHRYR